MTRLLHVSQTLLEERDDVPVVERVEDHPALSPRFDEPQIAEQPQLVRNGRFRQPNQLGQIAHAQLASRKGVEHADTCRVAERAKRLRQLAGIVVVHQNI